MKEQRPCLMVEMMDEMTALSLVVLLPAFQRRSSESPELDDMC